MFMRKAIIAGVMAVMLSVCMVSCGTRVQAENSQQSDEYFVTIDKWVGEIDQYFCQKSYELVYAKDTGVKYIIVYGHKSLGITPLYNPDGSLQIYEKADE